jgi:hypothetical protein
MASPPRINVYALLPLVVEPGSDFDLSPTNWSWVHCLTLRLETLNAVQEALPMDPLSTPTHLPTHSSFYPGLQPHHGIATCELCAHYLDVTCVRPMSGSTGNILRFSLSLI